jgi:hypothetical protein
MDGTRDHVGQDKPSSSVNAVTHVQSVPERMVMMR